MAFLDAILSINSRCRPCNYFFSLNEVTPGSAVYNCCGHLVKSCGYGEIPPAICGWGLHAYITRISAGIFFVPVALLVFWYGSLCRTILRNLQCKTRRKSTDAVKEACKIGIMCRSSLYRVATIPCVKLHKVMMTFVVVLAYEACWPLLFSVQMWSVWDMTLCSASCGCLETQICVHNALYGRISRLY